MNGSSHSSRALLAEINLTPFVDIMMVLLIVFMVTAPLMQHGLDVNLPQAKSPVMEKQQDDVVLTVKKDGSMYLGKDKNPVSIGFLEHKLEEIFKYIKKKDLYIRADDQVLYGRIVNIMAVAKAAGVERIGMITKPISKVSDDTTSFIPLNKDNSIS